MYTIYLLVLKHGDNVVVPSENMKWYEGKTFLRLLETIEIKKNKNSSEARFPVQTVIRPSQMNIMIIGDILEELQEEI